MLNWNGYTDRDEPKTAAEKAMEMRAAFTQRDRNARGVLTPKLSHESPKLETVA